MGRALVIMVVALILGGIAAGGNCCANGCDRGYSDGARSGMIVKFSRKGVAIKSWEGQMVLGGMKQTTNSDGQTSLVANTWDFTVRDDGPVAAVQAAFDSGRPAKLTYVQWLASGCRMESQYEVIAVEQAKER